MIGGDIRGAAGRQSKLRQKLGFDRRRLKQEEI